MKRFWNKVEKTKTCWNWKASNRGVGYGGFKYEGKVYTAHRFVWFLTYGYFPKELICHKCDNRKCVNPKHLYEGTQKQNVKDAIKRKRHVLPVPKRKITIETANEIRNKYKEGDTSTRKLAKEYGFKSNHSILEIIHNRYYSI